MQLSYSPADEAFRQEVRHFLAANLPRDIARRERQGFHIPKPELRPWLRTLYDRGWAAPGWPSEHGGTGWTPLQRHIWDEEAGLADAPEGNVASLGLVGPVVWRFGSEDLKARFLQPILRGDLIFCQGFSEPSAGSDLANLRTRAVRDGDHYIVTGQKIWTSSAHVADHIIILCRTDPAAKPQAGLSMLLARMDSPGITVRPIHTIDEQNVNEVFLDEVRVPAENLVGEENRAWTYAKFLLANERTGNAHVGHLKRYLRRLPELADAVEVDEGRTVWTDAFRRRLALLEIDVAALEWTVLRLIASANTPAHGAMASAVKVRGSELLLRASELELDVLGPQVAAKFRPGDPVDGDLPGSASTDAPGLMSQYLYWRASTIFGGTNDIQRQIIWNSLFR